MLKNIELEQAKKIIAAAVKSGGSERIPLTQGLGRVLGLDVYALESLPPFDRSALDGFALKSEDISSASPDSPVDLMIIGEVSPGYAHKITLQPGSAIQISTGAPIPQGADVVIRQEDTTVCGKKVSLKKPVSTGSNICRAGEDVAVGERVLRAGTRIGPAEIGLLAALGIIRVVVFRRPAVALFSTGDELVSINTRSLNQGKIRNSNIYALAAMVQELGAEPLLFGAAADRLEATAAKFIEAAQGADLIVSTGGVSVGKYDVVRDALTKIGAGILFWRVAMKPGTPVVCARKGKKLFIALSGNPAAAMVTFDQLARPAILKAAGLSETTRPKVNGILENDFIKGGNQRRFLRAFAYWTPSGYRVRVNGQQGPGMLKSVIACNAFVDVAPGRGPLKEGEEVPLILLKEVGRKREMEEYGWQRARKV